MLAYKSIIVTHQTIRTWAEKFGRDYANNIRRRIPTDNRSLKCR